MASITAPFDAARAHSAAEEERGAAQAAAFDAIYEKHAGFVWRSVCRLGVPHEAAADVVQEIFLVVYRRLAEFEEREATGSWLYAIVIRVVRQHRRTMRRKSTSVGPRASAVDPEALPDGRQLRPDELAEREEALRTLYEALDRMSDDRREVFVLSELEQLSAPEIASALAVNLNTVYWRLRTARQEFEKIVLRMRRSTR